MKKTCLLIATFILTTSVLFSQLNDSNFFPRAVWLQSTFRAEAYKEVGINTYIGLWNQLDSLQLSDLNQAGMYLITKQNDYGIDHLNDTIILAWKQDKSEPDNAQWNSNTSSFDPCYAPSILIDRYNEIKAVDPDRPVFIGLGRGVSDINWIGRGECYGDTDSYKEDLNGYIKAGDIVSYDIYPVNSTLDEDSEKLWYVPKGMDSLIVWSSSPKMFFAWIETTKFDASSNRGPTPAEVNSEVWMAIIHGANGIGYFCHRLSPDFDEAALLHDAIMIQKVKEINYLIDSLSPVLNSPNTNYSSAISSNIDVPVDIMTKSYDGFDYIFAVAMRPGTTQVNFSVPDGVVIEVVGENRTLYESDGQFLDEFSDYGVHIYKVVSVSSSSNVRVLNNNVFYPNPTSGEMFLLSSYLDTKFIITSTNGTIVMKGDLVKDKIDISRLKSGMYFIELINKRGLLHETHKVVKL